MLSVSFQDSYVKAFRAWTMRLHKGLVIGGTKPGPGCGVGDSPQSSPAWHRWCCRPSHPGLGRVQDGDSQRQERHQLVIIHACGTALGVGIGCYAESPLLPLIKTTACTSAAGMLPKTQLPFASSGSDLSVLSH